MRRFPSNAWSRAALLAAVVPLPACGQAETTEANEDVAQVEAPLVTALSATPRTPDTLFFSGNDVLGNLNGTFNIWGMTVAHQGENPGSAVTGYFTQGSGLGAAYFLTAQACSGASCPSETDRWQINLNTRIKRLYGLGMQGLANQVGVRFFPATDAPGTQEELWDSEFAVGRMRTDAELDADCAMLPGCKSGARAEFQYHQDYGRLRTPVFVVPEKNLIIAYLQPNPKMVRIRRSKDANNPTPQGTDPLNGMNVYTSFVLKQAPFLTDRDGGQHPLLDSAPAPLLIIHGNDMASAYSLYRQALKKVLLDVENTHPHAFDFKFPSKAAFGLDWETYGEFDTQIPLAGGATSVALRETRQRLSDAHVAPSVFIQGSGYWAKPNMCSPNAWTKFYGGIWTHPSTESLVLREGTSYSDWEQELQDSYRIAPGIGMRHHGAAQLTMMYANDGIDTNACPPDVTWLPSPCQNPVIGTDGPPLSSSQGYQWILRALGMDPFLRFPERAEHSVFSFMRMAHTDTVVGAIIPFDQLNATAMTKFVQTAHQVPGVSNGHLGYGNFRAIKEDEMFIGVHTRMLPSGYVPTDRMSYTGDTSISQSTAGSPPNAPIDRYLPDGSFRLIYDYYRKNIDDIVILGRNDWFSTATDLQNGPGSVETLSTTAGSLLSYWPFKFGLDQMLTHVTSGYFHPKLEQAGVKSPSVRDSSPDCANLVCPDEKDKDGIKIPVDGEWCSADSHGVLQPMEGNEVPSRFDQCCRIGDGEVSSFVREAQLHAFMPGAVGSLGFWHLGSGADIVTWAYQLRMRLQQYAYDQAVRTFDDGQPHLMRPLWLDDASDTAHTIYAAPSAANTSDPIDEFFFGNALLVRPLLRATDTLAQQQAGLSMNVYFPPGRYMEFISGHASTVYNAGMQAFTLSTTQRVDYPVFLKFGEILVIGDAMDPSGRESRDAFNPNNLNVVVALDATTPSSTAYTLHLRKANAAACNANPSCFDPHGSNSAALTDGLVLQAFHGSGTPYVQATLNGSTVTKPLAQNAKGLWTVPVDQILALFGQEYSAAAPSRFGSRLMASGPRLPWIAGNFTTPSGHSSQWWAGPCAPGACDLTPGTSNTYYDPARGALRTVRRPDGGPDQVVNVDTSASAAVDPGNYVARFYFKYRDGVLMPNDRHILGWVDVFNTTTNKVLARRRFAPSQFTEVNSNGGWQKFELGFTAPPGSVIQTRVHSWIPALEYPLDHQVTEVSRVLSP
ncbi:hypothetical protein [Sorangium sp. So ce1182]|uniref:hypothetical protein n=1 Tax=Sorangium sp. So ce1182 TaxID=3133334 RepID=UPI003F641E07